MGLVLRQAYYFLKAIVWASRYQNVYMHRYLSMRDSQESQSLKPVEQTSGQGSQLVLPKVPGRGKGSNKRR